MREVQSDLISASSRSRSEQQGRAVRVAGRFSVFWGAFHAALAGGSVTHAVCVAVSSLRGPPPTAEMTPGHETVARNRSFIITPGVAVLIEMWVV